MAGLSASADPSRSPAIFQEITETKKVRVEAGKRARVGFTMPVGQNEIDLHQSLGYSTKTCKVVVSMVDTFGTPS